MSNELSNIIILSGEFIAVFVFLFIWVYWLLGRCDGVSKRKRIILTVVPALIVSGLWVWLTWMFEGVAVLLLVLSVLTCTGTVLWVLFYRASGMWLAKKNEGRSAKRTKGKRIGISIISTVVAMALLLYLAFGFLSAKPGMNGFEVTNGVIYMVMTNKDYVRVGENRYLYKTGNLSKLIENEYDSFRFDEDEYKSPYDTLAEEDETTIVKVGIVSKDGQEFEARNVGVGAWSIITGERISSLYYVPHE